MSKNHGINNRSYSVFGGEDNSSVASAMTLITAMVTLSTLLVLMAGEPDLLDAIMGWINRL